MKLDHSSLEADTGWSEIELERMGVRGVERTGGLYVNDFWQEDPLLGRLEGLDKDPEVDALHSMMYAGVYRRSPSRKDQGRPPILK